MPSLVHSAVDARQTPQWGEYLKGIGWKVEIVGKTQLFILRIPLFNVSFIKVQHPTGPLPFKKIDQVAKKNKAAWVLIEPHELGYNEKDFTANGYIKSKVMYTHTSTIKIDLTKNEKELFKSFSENARRNIKKAQKENLEVKAIFMKDKKNWHYFEEFYSLLKSLTKIKKFYVPSHSEYVKKMTAFKDTSILMFAYENGTPICVVWLAYFDNVIAYFQTGITQRGYDTLANYLLVWEGLKLAKRLKLKVFDFESIFDERYPKNLPEKKKYTGFKKRFHGEIILYPPSWIKTYTFFGKLLYLWDSLF